MYYYNAGYNFHLCSFPTGNLNCDGMSHSELDSNMSYDCTGNGKATLGPNWKWLCPPCVDKIIPDDKGRKSGEVDKGRRLRGSYQDRPDTVLSFNDDFTLDPSRKSIAAIQEV